MLDERLESCLPQAALILPGALAGHLLLRSAAVGCERFVTLLLLDQHTCMLCHAAAGS
jgi:hypothetical protein